MAAVADATTPKDRDDIAKEAESALLKLGFLSKERKSLELVRYLALKAACTEIQTPNGGEDGGPAIVPSSDSASKAPLRPWLSPGPVLDEALQALVKRTREWEAVQEALKAVGESRGMDTSVHHDSATAEHGEAAVLSRRQRALDLYQSVWRKEAPEDVWGSVRKGSLWPDGDHVKIYVRNSATGATESVVVSPSDSIKALRQKLERMQLVNEDR